MSYIENRAEIKFNSYVGEDKLRPSSREYTFLPADASSNVKIISDLYVIDGSVTDSTLTYSAQSTGILTIFVDPDGTGDLTLKINGDTNGNTLAPRRIVSGAITGLTVTNGSSSTRQIVSYTFIPNGTINATDSNVTVVSDKVKVTSNDTTADFLLNKLTAGSNITLTEANDGGDETITIARPYTITAIDQTDDGYTTTVNDDVVVATISSNITVNVLAAASMTKPVTIKNAEASTGVLTVDGNGSETIDGSASITVYKGQSRTLVPSGGNLHIV